MFGFFSDKSVEIWSPETKQLVKKFDHIMDGKIANISFLRNHVWIYGDQGTYGIICIFDPQTFELVKKITDVHKGQIYHAAQVGEYIWTVAWDQKIIAWDNNFNKVRSIPHIHRDSITVIEVQKSKTSGWKVWTGSLDRSIDITHVPDNYESSLREMENSIDEDDLPTTTEENLPVNLVETTIETPDIVIDDSNFIKTRKKSVGGKTKEKRLKMAKQGKIYSALDLKKMKEMKKKSRVSERPNVKKENNSKTERRLKEV